MGKSTPPAIGPTGLAFDASGNMYVGDGPNVWRLSPSAVSASHSAIAYWRFDEGRPNIAASGLNTILDSSGNDLDGTPINGPVYSSSVGADPVPLTGEANKLSLKFNGVNQRIFIPDDRLFRLTHSLTLEAYINLSAWPGGPVHGGQILFRGDDRPGLDPYTLDVHNHNLQFHIEGE
jgi:hypothetical protein